MGVRIHISWRKNRRTKMENQNMENEYERVILSQLIERCHERLPLYDKKVVKEIIKVF